MLTIILARPSQLSLLCCPLN